jgi:hypothetical protein
MTRLITHLTCAPVQYSRTAALYSSANIWSCILETRHFLWRRRSSFADCERTKEDLSQFLGKKEITRRVTFHPTNAKFVTSPPCKTCRVFLLLPDPFCDMRLEAVRRVRCPLESLMEEHVGLRISCAPGSQISPVLLGHPPTSFRHVSRTRRLGCVPSLSF